MFRPTNLREEAIRKGFIRPAAVALSSKELWDRGYEDAAKAKYREEAGIMESWSND